MNINILSKEEKLYTYAKPIQVKNQTGFIGHLRGDFGCSGNEFWTSWFEHSAPTDDFRKAFGTVMNYLSNGILKDYSAMNNFCNEHRDAFIEDYSYGFGVKEGDFTFLIRCITPKRDYNFYIMCYESERLYAYLEKNKL